MFKDRLKEMRISKGLTQEELAEKIHVSRSAISKWEMGNGIPSEPNIEGLCEFFNVEEEWLLDRDDLKQQIICANDINKKINLTSILGIIISIVLFIVSFIRFIETTYSVPEGGNAAIMPLIITSVASQLKLKIIPFFLIYFLLMVVSIFSLVKIIDEHYKRKILILNYVLIVSSVFVFLLSYILAINSFVN